MCRVTLAKVSQCTHVQGPHLLGQGFQGFLRLVPSVGVWDEAGAHLMADLLSAVRAMDYGLPRDLALKGFIDKSLTCISLVSCPV